MDVIDTWTAAARAFADLVARVPGDRWGDPGLGEWTMRDLVGHTCSAGLRTIVSTLGQPADVEDIPSAAAYYAFGRSVDPAWRAAAIAASTEDAQRTGAGLGEDPAVPVRRLVEDATAAVAAARTDMLVPGAAGGMRLAEWLRTRTFELAVHSLDIANALGVSSGVPDAVVSDASALAAQVATAVGQGRDVLLALTGRGDLPDGFSVV